MASYITCEDERLILKKRRRSTVSHERRTKTRAKRGRSSSSARSPEREIQRGYPTPPKTQTSFSDDIRAHEDHRITTKSLPPVKTPNTTQICSNLTRLSILSPWSTRPLTPCATKAFLHSRPVVPNRLSRACGNA